MKVLTILGTRPELIRLSRIIPKLDRYTDHILVDTNQNYDDKLSKIFYDGLGIRSANYTLGAKGSLGEQLGTIVTGLERIIEREKPDAFLVLGDTNSSLGSIAAKRHGVRVFHMEAGNRCYDDRVPEEVNRRLIDHSSDILLPYTERSKQNLLAEGIAHKNIFVTGNPIYEVMQYYNYPKSTASDYILITLHRAENVDNVERLTNFVEAFNKLAKQRQKKLVWSVHPRTRKLLSDYSLNPLIDIREPMGFAEFLAHEKNAWCVLTDSGTVQEECAILQTPVVTLRDTTERPETIDFGSNFISGSDVDIILYGVNLVTKRDKEWDIPSEYLVDDVSDRILNIVTGYYR